MHKGDRVSWARLGRVEKAFFIVASLCALFYFTGLWPALQVGLAVAGFILGVGSLVRLARYGLQNLIWRLRNRLIVAYLFIAVVPIVLVLALLATTAYVVVGQMAVYLVNTELQQPHEIAGFPGGFAGAGSGPRSAGRHKPRSHGSPARVPQF